MVAVTGSCNLLLQLETVTMIRERRSLACPQLRLLQWEIRLQCSYCTPTLSTDGWRCRSCTAGEDESFPRLYPSFIA